MSLERTVTEHTRLLYVTTGVLLQKLILTKSLTQYTHIFVDEVCERCSFLSLAVCNVPALERSPCLILMTICGHMVLLGNKGASF